jgi:DNA polymerase III delta prime subunit
MANIMIIGNSKISHYFVKAIQNGNLAHAYTLIGPNGIGKKHLAKQLAANILGIKVQALAVHPDFYLLERATDIKTGKLKKDLSVTQARELRARLQSRSWSGGYQVAVIDGADALNQESGNALLKVLEEPPPQSVIFLLAQDDGALLPTIRSRAQLFNLTLVSKHELSTGLAKLNFAQETIEKVLPLAWGRPGRAINFCQNQDLLKNELKEIERFNNLQNKSFYKKIELIEDLFEDKDDAVKGREKLIEVLGLWMVLFREKLLPAEQSTGQKIATIIDSINTARQQLKQNVHPRLVMELVVNSW